MTDLPEIPTKRYFTIGEVGELCALKAHVLRYWEQEFPQLKPTKRRGNRRYYQHEDIVLIRQIRRLLYEEGFTVSGARSKLSTQTAEIAPQQSEKTLVKTNNYQGLINELESVLAELSS